MSGLKGTTKKRSLGGLILIVARSSLNPPIHSVWFASNVKENGKSKGIRLDKLIGKYPHISITHKGAWNVAAYVSNRFPVGLGGVLFSNMGSMRTELQFR